MAAAMHIEPAKEAGFFDKILPRQVVPSGLLGWITTVDHKRIGILYGVTALFWFLVGGLEALLIRSQLARPGQHLYSAETYNQLFTMHGTTMIFLVVMPLAVINADARVGDGAIINTAAVVEHDCMIGAYAHVCPRVALAGNVAVGERVQIGIGSCVIQGLSIGAGSIVGAGSVVVKNTAANVVTFGSPAQVYRKLA